MSTLSQVGRIGRIHKKPLSRTPRLRRCPQAKGLVVRVVVMNPKKPNSAMRHVAKVRLYSKPRVTARIPGVGYGLTRFNRVLIRGGRANDLPGVGYAAVRGVFDFPPMSLKRRRRSFYGAARLPEAKTFVRRRNRKHLIKNFMPEHYLSCVHLIPTKNKLKFRKANFLLYFESLTFEPNAISRVYLRKYRNKQKGLSVIFTHNYFSCKFNKTQIKFLIWYYSIFRVPEYRPIFKCSDPYVWHFWLFALESMLNFPSCDISTLKFCFFVSTQTSYHLMNWKTLPNGKY